MEAVAPAERSISQRTRSFLAEPRRMLIGGQWLEAASGKTFPVYDPATGEEVARVAEGDKEDIDRAVKAAREAFEDSAWSRMKPAERERLLIKLAGLVEANADELAELETLDNGKNIRMARHVDVSMSVDFLRYMAGWATKIEGSVIDASLPYVPGGEFFAYTHREPVGVVGQIIPWNFPLLMAAWKLGPVLATGCTSVLKPAEETPLTALRLGELVQEAGYPDGVVNIVPGLGHTAGAALVKHPEVDKIAFTGSTEVGKLIQREAVDTLKRVSLELGGKSPVIVFADADLETAVPGAANAIFFNQGQVCTAGSRLYAHKSIFEKLTEGIAAYAKGLKIGSGLDPSTQIGPLVSKEQQARVMHYIESGLAEGAKVLAGGKPLDRPGYFLPPTVLTNTTEDMRVVREEIFGPVLVAMPYEDLDEVVKRANDTIYGLGASIWTRDFSTVHRMTRRLRAGTVWVNCHNLLDAALPFGGYKQSGIGRELGRAAIEGYTETKSVLAAL